MLLQSSANRVGSTRAELFKGTESLASGLSGSISVATFDVSLRYRGTEKRLNGGIRAKERGREGGSGDAKGQVQPGPVVVVSHGGVCTATERREDTIYIFIPRGRSHRIDGRRRDALSSAAGGTNRGRSPRPFRDRGFLISSPTGGNVVRGKTGEPYSFNLIRENRNIENNSALSLKYSAQ